MFIRKGCRGLGFKKTNMLYEMSKTYGFLIHGKSHPTKDDLGLSNGKGNDKGKRLLVKIVNFFVLLN